MPGELSPIDKAKFVAAKRACDYVEDGMRVGLGTGSTAAWLVRCLGEMVREEGLKIRGVPTSTRTAELAREVGIEVISLDEAKWLDVTIDGADEFDGDLNLIKGGGGALLHEKIVAAASKKFVVIVDSSKLVDKLGAFKVPVEALHFAARPVRRQIEALGGRVTTREKDGQPFVTQEGNLIYDCDFGLIDDPTALAESLGRLPGLVEHGLFVGMTDTLIVGRGDTAEVIAG